MNRILRMALWLAAATLSAQQQDATAQLSGTLRNAVTSLPIPKATLRLLPVGGRVGYIRTTSDAGTFSIEGIIPGDYQLRVQRRGFLDIAKTAQSGSTVHLAANQKATEMDVVATPLAVISGTVTGADGEPLPYSAIHLIVLRWSMHGRRYQDMTGDRTNEEGEFRLNDLEPGRYYLCAGRPDEGPMAGPVRDAAGKGELSLASVYYPNAASIDGAAPIDLRAGQELTGIALRLSWTPSFHVRGQMSGGVEEVQLVKRHNDGTLRWEELNVTPARDSSFDIAGVTPGAYYLRGASNWKTGVNQPVAVDSHDVNGLSVPGGLLEFRAHVDTQADGVRLHLKSNDGPGFSHEMTIPVQLDGTARLAGIPMARYTLWATSRAGGFYVTRVRIGQQELRTPELDFTSAGSVELEISMSKGGGRIQGTAQWPDPAKSAPAFAASDPIKAVLVPEEARVGIPLVWFSEVDQNGSFRFSDIPPGKYFAFVTANLDEGLWTNREFVALVQGGGTAVELPDQGSVQAQVPALPLTIAQRAMESIR